MAGWGPHSILPRRLTGRRRLAVWRAGAGSQLTGASAQGVADPGIAMQHSVTQEVQDRGAVARYAPPRVTPQARYSRFGDCCRPRVASRHTRATLRGE